MNFNIRFHIAAGTLFFLFVMANVGAAQNAATVQHLHHHYKLIDLGTFGGPQSYINGFEYSGPLQNLNNWGLLAGWSDTSTLDPYQSSSNEFGPFCFNVGETPCYASHAFLSLGSSIFDLGTLPGGYSSATTWISSNGFVAGVSQNGEFDPQETGSPTNYPELRAVLWGYGQIIDLGTLEGGPESGASSVNNRGQVVGWAINTVPDANSLFYSGNEYNFYQPIEQYETRAFLWQNGVMTDLGTLGTGNDAWAQAINDNGQITGISYTNTTVNSVSTPCGIQGTLVPTEDPFFWENGKMTDMGGLGGTCGQPLAINSFGQVVGVSDLSGDLASHPFLWTKRGGMKDLGTLGGHSGTAQMINDRGVVVGGTELKGDSQLDAFLWDGKMHDLGALDGCSYAYSVNNREQVVGNWGGANCGEGAFLWEDGGPMVDVSTLLTSPTDLALFTVSNNDLGEIAGIGVKANGYSHAILLVPCDENHRGIEDCDYNLVDASTAGQVGAPAANQGNLTSRDLPHGLRSMAAGRNRRFTFLDPEHDEISNSLSQRSAERCVPKGGQCPPRTHCCPGLQCAAASTRVFCE